MNVLGIFVQVIDFMLKASVYFVGTEQGSKEWDDVLRAAGAIGIEPEPTTDMSEREFERAFANEGNEPDVTIGGVTRHKTIVQE